MAEIIWNKGQGEFDFDYLLNLTNQKFVDSVLNSIQYDELKVSTIKVSDFPSVVQVIVYYGYAFKVFQFYKISENFESVSLVYDDLKWMHDTLGGVTHE